MYKILLDEEDLNNLKVFLSRTQLTGRESLAFNKLLNTIYNCEEVKEEVE